MKVHGRIRAVWILSLIFFMVSSSMAEKNVRGLNLRLSGGIGNFALGDFNSFFKDTVPYYDFLLSPDGFKRQGSFKEFSRIWNASGEIRGDFR